MKIQSIVCLIIMIVMISCSPYTRQAEVFSTNPKDPVYSILHYASLAVSSHNTQPWKVDVIGSDSIVVFPDLSRKLKIVDSCSRELYISLGAFIENLDIAANHFGYVTTIKVCLADNSPVDSTFISVSLRKGVKANIAIRELENRRTLRQAFDTAQISDSAISLLTQENAESIHFIQAPSVKGKYIRQQTIEAYSKQSRNKDAQDELSQWLRFSNADAKNKRDGLTTSGMEIKGLAGWVVRCFFKPSDSKKETFISGGIEKTCNQAENCAGWILVTQQKDTPESWISTGRMIERLNIKCRGLKIGFHPMSQMIEEPDFEKQVNAQLGFSGIIQFVARVGYVKTYPEPVSVRRQVDLFSTFK